MPQIIQIHASDWGTSGEIVLTEDGQVVWGGPIEEIAEAGGFDALFCHSDDEPRLRLLCAQAGLRVGN